MNGTQSLKITREEMFVRFVVLLAWYVTMQALSTGLRIAEGFWSSKGSKRLYSALNTSILRVT